MTENRLFWVLFALTVLFTGFLVFLGLPWSVTAYHLIAMATIHYCFTIAWSLMTSNIFRVALLFLYQASVTFIYFIICIGLIYWGDILSLSILKPYLFHLNNFCASVSISPIYVYGFLFGFMLLHLFAAIFICNRIQPNQEQGLSRWQIAGLFLIVLLCFPLKRFLHFRGEPFLVFVFDKMWGAADNPFFNPYRMRVATRDRAVAKNYIKKSNNTRNVILIVCDALRADHLPIYGYNRNTTPFLCEMYAQGKLQKIENNNTTAASTICGIPSLLQSKEWKSCTYDGFNLFTLFKKQGYQTAAIIAGAHKEWYNIAGTYARDCDFYFDGMNAQRYYFKDDRVVLEGLENRTFQTQSNFLYLHLQSPHETALLQQQFAVWKPYEKTTGSANNRLLRLKNLYDNKILQADFTIQKIFETLEQKGILKDALVIITADHGEGLGEHGVDGHVDWLYQAQTRVPLLIIDNQNKYPSQKFSRQIDIAPTIAQALHFTLPSCWQGVSLLDDRIVKYSYHETGKTGLETKRQQYAIIANEDSVIYKYIFSRDFKQEELYELKSDSTELHNLTIGNTALAKRFRLFAIQNFNAHFDLGD